MNEKFEVRDLRAKERFFMDDEFFNGYVKIIGTNALGVYCSLCRHADKSQKCFPSVSRIAKELSVSSPTVIGCISVLEYFEIIKKRRVGKQCTNRYYLLDKKTWRKDWGVMLNDLTSGEVKLGNFKNKLSLLQALTELTSNSKETQEKGNTKERNNKKNISENEISTDVKDILKFFSSEVKREKNFFPKINKEDNGIVSCFLEASANGASYREFDKEDLKRMISYFIRNNDNFKNPYISISNAICEDVFNQWQRNDPQEVVRRLDVDAKK